MSDATAIAGAIARTDYFRGSPAAVGGRGAHKEWQHFVILADGLDLLVNFSCLDEVRPGAARDARFPRVVLLVRERDWDGDVETFSNDETRVRNGTLEARLGRNSLSFRDGAFHIDVALADRPIELSLRLTPVTMPAYVPNVAMLDGPPMNWVVVPRMRTDGTLKVGDRRYEFEGVPAYHDHNWGHFLWGNDVSWEWGFVLPDDSSVPWSMTFVRLTNRVRTMALMQNLLLWRGIELVAIFRAREAGVRTGLGFAQPRRVFKVPRPMALLAPEQIADVPGSWGIRAATGDDWVDVSCQPEAVAQVLIPSEARLGVTIFNEVAARSEVGGVFRGEKIEFSGRSILEFIRG